MNCFIINQIKNGNIGSTTPNSNIFDWDGPFEVIQITARYEYLGESGQSKIEGRLSDSTGSILVMTPKSKDSDDIPEFIKNFNQ